MPRADMQVDEMRQTERFRACPATGTELAFADDGLRVMRRNLWRCLAASLRRVARLFALRVDPNFQIFRARTNRLSQTFQVSLCRRCATRF